MTRKIMVQLLCRAWSFSTRVITLCVVLNHSALASSIASLEQQALLDNADAQYQLGLAYETGQGVKQDLANASHWYQQASNNGHLNATYNYAQALEYGRGITQNTSRAALLYTKLAVLGDKSTYGKLAKLYSDNKVNIPAADQAVLWYSLAVEQSSAFEAEFELALQQQFNERQRRQIDALQQQEGATPQPAVSGNNQSYNNSVRLNNRVAMSWTTHFMYWALLLLILTVVGYYLTQFKRALANERRGDQRLQEALQAQQRTITALQHKLKISQTAPHSAPVTPPSNAIEEAYLRFGFSPNQRKLLTPTLLKSRYKQLSRIFHPDIQGSEDEMKQLNIAFKTLMAHVKKSQKIH
ncbi:J domain-containing protein [Vibrio methylphosphonaticus]|uniref:J domain-containing protein n=1 Tax=Vibrio methylphosphonaticus TaxID=2946866 RepID=UPI00202A33AE|nr:J domain-containing protein [Vibrio methylphosphonaticus]MCL9774858.1 J domain-containing protein [Vibrio methylphosphonaticus]